MTTQIVYMPSVLMFVYNDSLEGNVHLQSILLYQLFIENSISLGIINICIKGKR